MSHKKPDFSNPVPACQQGNSVQATKLIVCRMPIFLFNYTDKMMHGIFRAVTPGTLNINPYGE